MTVLPKFNKTSVACALKKTFKALIRFVFIYVVLAVSIAVVFGLFAHDRLQSFNLDMDMVLGDYDINAHFDQHERAYENLSLIMKYSFYIPLVLAIVDMVYRFYLNIRKS